MHQLSKRPLPVSTHSRPKAAGTSSTQSTRSWLSFNTQPPEGGWPVTPKSSRLEMLFQHTAARRRLVPSACNRPRRFLSFNTQPPEGGWALSADVFAQLAEFQHTAARRRLGGQVLKKWREGLFQHTAARRRLADSAFGIPDRAAGFNTQPPEGGWVKAANSSKQAIQVSTHSRPKAAGGCLRRLMDGRPSFNTQPPEGGWISVRYPYSFRRRFNTQPPEGGWFASRYLQAGTRGFQHTAARRRLAQYAARPRQADRFNTQPPEGGWFPTFFHLLAVVCFNTQPPEGGWGYRQATGRLQAGFNTQPPEGGWLTIS